MPRLSVSKTSDGAPSILPHCRHVTFDLAHLMLKSLIILSDEPQLGKPMRGQLLLDFLRAYFSEDEVRAVSLADLPKLGSVKTETLFIGVPTSLNRETFRHIDFQRAALFDYHDSDRPRWGNSDRDFLLSLTDQYLRCYSTKQHHADIRLGLLPLYRKPNLGRAVRSRQFFTRTLRRRIKRVHDVGFLGAPTEVRIDEDGQSSLYNQRIEWLRELLCQDTGLRVWGGLACSRQTKRCLTQLEQKYGDLRSMIYSERRTNFFHYFYQLCRSHVALAPAGYSRWSFRHYEALYAGAAVVSTDMQDVDLLVPLPRENMYFVPDRASVLSAVNQALQDHRATPERFEANIEFLEQYLCCGRYSRNRPVLLDRFMSQFSEPAGCKAA